MQIWPEQDARRNLLSDVRMVVLSIEDMKPKGKVIPLGSKWEYSNTHLKQTLR